MTREEAKTILKNAAWLGTHEDRDKVEQALEMAIQALENHDTFMKYAYSQGKHDALSQEPCDDAISREALKKMLIGLDKWHVKNKQFVNVGLLYDDVFFGIEQLPSVTHKSGKCKNCKYFEYDSVAKVDGIPLIVAHEICNKWGNGCKTSEDGYCYLFEPQESETWNGIHGQITAPKGTFERIFNEADDDNDI